MKTTFKDFLIESLNSPIQYKWVKSYADGEWEATFNIDGTEYRIIIEPETVLDVDEKGEPLEYYSTEISFYALGEYRNYDISATGKNQQYKVISTVLAAVEEYFQKEGKPDVITFSADGSSRVKLYDRLIKRIPHDRVEKIQGDSMGTKYFVWV